MSDESSEMSSSETVGSTLATADAQALVRRAQLTGRVTTTASAGAVSAGSGAAEQPEESAEPTSQAFQDSEEVQGQEPNTQAQQHPNPQLNPNYPFGADEPSDFVVGDQESDKATEEATSSSQVESQAGDEGQRQNFSNPHLNPNHPFDVDKPSDFAAGDQASEEATEVATSPEPQNPAQEQAQDGEDGEQPPVPNPENIENADEVLEFVVEEEAPPTPTTVEIELSERSKNQSQEGDGSQRGAGGTTFSSSSDSDSDSDAENSQNSEQGSDQGANQPVQEQERESGSDQETEQSFEQASEEDEKEKSASASDDINLVEDEVNTPTTVSTELLVWRDAESKPEQRPYGIQQYPTAPEVGPTPPTPSTVSSELLVFSEESQSDPAQETGPTPPTPSTVCSELLVFSQEAQSYSEQHTDKQSEQEIGPAPPTPSTVCSELLVFSQDAQSYSEQHTEQKSEEESGTAPPTPSTVSSELLVFSEKAQQEDGPIKERTQEQEQAQEEEEQDEEPTRRVKRKSRARSPSPGPQPKRRQTVQPGKTQRRGTAIRLPKRKETEITVVPSKKRKTNEDKGKSRGGTRPKPMNNAPTEVLDVYVCGLNTEGQLGLGHSNDNAIEPTCNPYLTKKKAGIVQVAAGGAHCVALTHDNKILTWGANHDGQLGRRTRNLDDDEYPLAQSTRPNKEETMPRDVDFSAADLPDDTVFTQVVATDSATFVLTEFGDVYGWGTFRDNKSKLKEKARIDSYDSDYEDNNDDGDREPIIGFFPDNDLCQLTPIKIEGLKHIRSLAAGSQHVLARHFRGSVYAWGAASRDQLGRKQLKRGRCAHPHLFPRVCIFPGNNCRSGFFGISEIGAGGHHSFAIKKSGEVYSWGWNMYGQTGVPEEESNQSESFLEREATVSQPTLVPELQGEEAVSVTGGMKHSIAVTKDNRCLSWGAIQGNALGIPDRDIDTNHVHSSEDGSVDEILEVPGLVTGIDGRVTCAAAGATHSLAVSSKRRAFGWGSNDEYEIGQQHKKEVDSATVIEGGALKGARVVAAVAGAQFTILLAE
ncbi:hypothetical protein ASPCAL10366 [Aspergillus calidoustus]|uniref:RCC1-like domain-containing protein n=1 Tax=Aspergillus calidoustus TaxID=454130 RepID=A0A0U5G6F4_ASPCI|nr:hypothetical protein ASPCAL10366 [Aspergillus calidoustus]